MIFKQDDENITIIDMNFESIDECTEFFNNEYGKLKVVLSKIEDKREQKRIKKFMFKYLRNQMFSNLKFLGKKDKEKLREKFNELKNKNNNFEDKNHQTNSQNKPRITGPAITGQIESGNGGLPT